MRFPRLVILIIALSAAGVGVAAAGDEVINRPLRILPGPGGGGWAGGGQLSPAGWPSNFVPRDFPSVLRDPALPNEPDGILWRRLYEANPRLDPLQVLTQAPAQLRRLQSPKEPAAPDTVRILALRVDFLTDSAGEGSSTLDGRFDLRHPDSAQVPVDPPPHNRAYFDCHFKALKRYWEKQSGGCLTLDWQIYPTQEDSAYHLSDTADYGPWVMVHGDEDLLALAEKFVRDSFAAADSSADPPDFRQYDSFIIFHAGADFQGDINRNSPYDIPSFNIYLSQPVTVQDSTFSIDLIMVVPEQVSQDGYLGAMNGVMAHEFAHQLGCFDLYNILTFYPMVGMFALQDSGDQLYGTVWDPYQEMEVFVRGAIPASVDPWQKLLFFRDGVRATWVRADTAIALPSVQFNNDMALVPIAGQGVAEWESQSHEIASEYFIIENRQYDLNGDGMVYLKSDSTTGVILGPMNIPPDVCDSLGIEDDELGQYEQDYLLPGEGILIWHVDNVAIADGFRVVYGGVNVIPGRPGLDVEEADGIDDLGDIYSVEWTGGQFDYWFQGGYSRLGPDTNPNSASSGGGISGISIEVLDSAAVEMRIDIHRGRVREGWPLYAGGRMMGAQGVSAVHLDRDRVAEIVTAGGRYVQVMYADGQLLMRAETDSLVLPGIAASLGFVDAGAVTRTLVAAATNTRVLAWEYRGPEVMRYPGGAGILPELRFTTPPLMLDSVIVIGDCNGRLRGLLPGHVPEMIWRTDRSGFPVTAIAAGEILGSEMPALVWGNSVGDVFLASGTERGGFEPAEGWPRSVSNAAVAVHSILLIQGPEGEGGRILAVDAAGQVVLWEVDGTLLTGWPSALDDAPAGPPVVGDPDGDGLLEIVVTTTAGEVHLLDLEGREEAGWPRSVWHPDVEPLGPLASGPILADLDPPAGDGRPEILQGSADGTLHVLNASGEEVDGWPAVVGYAVAAGPVVAESGEGGALQILAADEDGFVTILKTSVGPDSIGRGEIWNSSCDPQRTHLYPRSLLPEPKEMAGLIDTGSLRFTPNPVTGGQGWLRARMGLSGTLTVKLFDTSGHQAWEKVYQPAAGPQGNLLALDLGDLAPGLYVAKITARGGDKKISVLRKLAVVR